MNAEIQRGLFALLCILCVIVIGGGAWLEIARTRRGDSLLAPRHYRLRLFSAVIWIITLASLAGAVTIWWPPPNPTDNQRLQLYAVFTGATSLMCLGFVLLFVDLWMLSSARRKVERDHAIRFSEQLRELADKETARVRSQQAQQPKKVRAYAPNESSENASRNGSLDSSE